MRPIGGEIEVFFKDKIYYTDSGRSSLRIFCKFFKDKKILLPDFLCDVIVDTLKNENMKFDFYHIKEDLSIDWEKIAQDYDVLYIINYFGVLQKIPENIKKEKIIIEDNVFFYDFENRGFKKWFAFNSYRKITNLSDGSLIKTNMNVKNNYKSSDNSFSKLKYKAKELKYKYIYNQEGREIDYLNLFSKAENILGNSNSISFITENSIYLLSVFNYERSQKIRKKRFKMLLSFFKDICINKNPTEYSFFVIKSEIRDEIRDKLFQKKIFLPVHWPKSKYTQNSLYSKVLSIPLFENYTDEEFKYLLDSLKEIL